MSAASRAMHSGLSSGALRGTSGSTHQDSSAHGILNPNVANRGPIEVLSQGPPATDLPMPNMDAFVPLGWFQGRGVLLQNRKLYVNHLDAIQERLFWSLKDWSGPTVVAAVERASKLKSKIANMS